MCDTPRTDAKAQFFGFNPDEGEEFVQADFARELERENAALRADKERLDWLESVAEDVMCTGDDQGITIGAASNFQNYATNVATFRIAIDAARKEYPKWPTLEGRLANKLTSTEEAITQLKNTVEISPVAEQILNKNKSK
jgi:hypothetical protein